MKKLFLLLGASVLYLLSVQSTYALEYHRGIVTEVTQQGELTQDDQEMGYQTLQVASDQETFSVMHGTPEQPLETERLLELGDRVVVVGDGIDEVTYAIADVYRLPSLVVLGLCFTLIVAVVAGRRGVLAIVGMVVSLVLLTTQLLPFLLQGGNPLWGSVLLAFVLSSITVPLSHGVSRRSLLGLLAMYLSLTLVIILSMVVVDAVQLFGFGSEEAAFLQFGQTAVISTQGLLLGGIVLGALGVLDDICIAQVGIVFELKRANQSFGFRELYARSMEVGRDHVASLVNTLILAYAGANSALFVLLATSSETPLWVQLNSELLAEEIVRTLVGSIGLVVAVPLTSALAALFVQRSDVSFLQPSSHAPHSH